MNNLQLHPRFTPERFTHLLHRHGVSVLWEQPQLCTCWNQRHGQTIDWKTNQPDPYCPNCHGEGWVYLNPTLLSGILLTQLTPEKDFGVWGQIEEGDILCTVPNDSPAWRNFVLGDRLTILDITYTQFEQVTHGTAPGNDMLRYVPFEVLGIGYGATSYRPGLDYQIQANQIIWVGDQPPLGAIYGVRFTTQPQYMCWTRLPEPRIIDTAALPDKWWISYRELYQRRMQQNVQVPSTGGT